MTSAGQSAASLATVPERLALDEQVLTTGTRERFVLLLVLFVAVSSSAMHEATERLASAWGGRFLAVLLPYLGSAMLVITAGAVYRKLPRWKIRRDGLVPVGEMADSGRVRAELDRLLERAQLQVEPEWFYAPGAPAASAVVFGTHRHPKVCLNAGLVVCVTLAPATFRAVVLHELAHIRNRDVGITYATESVWRVLMATVLFPKAAVIVGAGFTGPAPLSPYELFQDSLVVALVYLTRADILRTREIYADRTAVHVWNVDPTDLLPARREPRLGAARFTRVRAAAAETWRTHPSWGLRGRALADSEMLFAQRAFTLLATGLAADIAAAQLTSPFRSAGEWPTSGQDAMLWQFGAPWSWPGMGQYLLIGGLTAGIGGVVLWRAILHAVLTGGPVPAGWWAGLWLGAGLALGELLNASVAERQLLPARPEVSVPLIAVVMLLMSWTAQYAQLRIYRGESIADGMVMGRLVPGLVLSFVLHWWVQEAWITGWRFSVADALNWAELPTADTSLAVRVMAVLTALPGSDMGFSGLWWSVSLLWLVPLQLWLARLPLPTAARLLGRIRPASVRRQNRRHQQRENSAFTPDGQGPPGLADKLPETVVVTFGCVICIAIFAGCVTFLLLLLFLLSAGSLGSMAMGLVLWSAILLLWRRPVRRGGEGCWLDQVLPGSLGPAANVPELGRFVRIGVVGGLVCCAGILAEPLVTGSAQGTTDWRIASIENLAWIVVVIVTMMLVVGAVAGWAAEGCYPILIALVASGLCGVIGLLGQGAKGLLDGCLGPVSSLAQTCAWQPARYAPLVEYALGYVMTLGLLAAAGGAALSHALATALRSRRRVAGPPPGTTDARRMASRRPVVGFFNTIAVGLILGTTTFQTLVMSAPLPRKDLLIEYGISPTGPIRSGISPIAEWMRHVGDTSTQASNALLVIADALDADPAASQRDDHTSAAKKLESACAKLTDVARNAKEQGWQISPSLPSDLKRAWNQYLSEVRTARGRCLALTAATTEADIAKAVEELLTAVKSMNKAGAELVALMKSR